MKKTIIIGLLIFVLCLTNVLSQTTDKEMVILPDGKVGIGTDAPSEKLEVSGNIKSTGRIKDKSGFVMPVGTILPYAGDKNSVPDGWLLCDGTAISSVNYPDLHNIISTKYGNGLQTTNATGAVVDTTSYLGGMDPTVPGSTEQCNFNVPDLRGQFLRGVDNGAGNDPDAAARTESKTGSNTGDNVGSAQGDAFQGHWHNLTASLWRDGSSDDKNKYHHNLTASFTEAVQDPINDGVNGDPRTSSETRPTNIYVNFIIKY